MPHNEHAADELNRLYPSLVPPPDEMLDDGDADARDGVYQHGLTIAEDIRDKTAAEGRRKRPLAVVKQQRTFSQPGQPSRSVCGGVTGRGTLHSTMRSTTRGGYRGQGRRDAPGQRRWSSNSDASDFASHVSRSVHLVSEALLFKHSPHSL
jgi:hypothetical protein